MLNVQTALFLKKKSQFYCAKIKIIEFVYDKNEKHSNIAKIIKIIE